jgi:hypothetical protein
MSLKDQVKGFRFMDIAGRKRILCVDDSPDSCTLPSFILKLIHTDEDKDF